jgi:hypothetical protein
MSHITFQFEKIKTTANVKERRQIGVYMCVFFFYLKSLYIYKDIK